MPCSPPVDLLNPGMKPRSPSLQADSLQSGPPRKSPMHLRIHSYAETLHPSPLPVSSLILEWRLEHRGPARSSSPSETTESGEVDYFA